MAGSSAADELVRADIIRRWAGLPTTARPPAVWIAHHAPVSVGHRAPGIVSPACAAWFAERRGVRPASVWAYARFRAVHEDQPWCGRPLRERSDVFGEPHRIAIATFARYAGTTAYWVALSWGGRHGEGLRVDVDNTGALHTREQLWIA